MPIAYDYDVDDVDNKTEANICGAEFSNQKRFQKK